MKVHIISTVNGVENEGMRNIAAHLSREFEKEHRVFYSGLKQFPQILRHCRRCDVTLLFARANQWVYWLARLAQALCPRLYLVLVQKPQREFLTLNRKHPLNCGWLAISPEDLSGIDSHRKYLFPLGIDTEKFAPGPDPAALKEKYGFSPDKPLTVHVGHCSAGRGLEAFLALEGQRLVVASGLFEDAATAARLEQDGVRILRGYLPHVEEIYQMADCYLFPTRSAEFVISIPLSAMEALSCGTPVVGRCGFAGLDSIQCAPGAVTRIDDPSQLNAILPEVMAKKRNHSLLACSHSWAEAAEHIMTIVKEEIR